jgi:hypothetical protein
MGRLGAILLAVTGTVAPQVVAQAVVLASVRFIDRRHAGRERAPFWISRSAPSAALTKPEAHALLFVRSVLAIRRGSGSAGQEPITEAYEERRRQH